jgi:hypothetical protein
VAHFVITETRVYRVAGGMILESFLFHILTQFIMVHLNASLKLQVERPWIWRLTLSGTYQIYIYVSNQHIL